MQQVEEHFMESDEKGMYIELLTDDIIPELIIQIFMKENNMDRTEVLKRIDDQDEKKKLFNVSTD